MNESVTVGTTNPIWPLDVSSTDSLVALFTSESLTGGVAVRARSIDTNEGIIDLGFNSVGGPILGIDSNVGLNAYLEVFEQNVKRLQLGQTFGGGQNLSVLGNLQIGIDSSSSGTGDFEIVKAA